MLCAKTIPGQTTKKSLVCSRSAATLHGVVYIRGMVDLSKSFFMDLTEKVRYKITWHLQQNPQLWFYFNHVYLLDRTFLRRLAPIVMLEILIDEGNS